MKSQKGFTIIELIVVIAIIAVLASIVMVNVTSYINKGKSSAVQGNLSSLLTNGAVYFESNPAKYGNDFVSDGLGCSAGSGGSTGTSAIAKAINGIGFSNVTCWGNTTAQQWCAYAIAVNSSGSQSNFCVDSSGYKGFIGSATTTCASGAKQLCQ